MASTSLYKPLDRYLTRFEKTSKLGDVHTLSIPSQSKEGKAKGSLNGWCEFTRYTLNEPLAIDEWGYPLFDLAECNPICPTDISR